MLNVKISFLGDYAKVFNFIDNQDKFGENDEFILEVIEWMEKNTQNFGGFNNLESLKNNLTTLIEAKNKKSKYFDQAKILKIEDIIKNNLELARTEVLNPNVINIYVFPTQSEFLLNVMKGLSGWCPSKDAIHLHIHPESPLLIPLAETVVHEYNHTVYRSYHNWDTVEEGLIAEGLAEHFREYLLGGTIAPWAGSLNEKEAFDWLEKIKPVLSSKDEKDYTNVFTNFDDIPYPHWIGYAIGYQLVKKFREKNKLNWDKLTKISVNKVLTIAN